MNRIIDTHTHYPGVLLGAAPRPIAAIREEFEQAGLCGAWIFTTDGLILDAEKSNDRLAEGIREHLDFFVPFCTVNPHRGAVQAVGELERAHRQLGMRGLKLHPWLQSFSLTNPELIPILRRAGELGMPVVFHDGTPPYATPLQIAWAAEQAPGTTFVLGHAGLDDLYEDAIRACLRRPNIYLGCCSVSSGHIADIIRRCPVERILFGSDGGFLPHIVEEAIEKVTATGAPDEVLRKIFYDNPRRILP